MKCVLIRHGKTAGNLAGRYIGCRTDEPLCPEGIAQLREGRYPAVERVFASPPAPLPGDRAPALSR